jgi:hypothetical protein
MIERLKKIVKHPDIQALLILCLLLIVGYWQVGLMIHPLKYDAIDCYFPSRFMVSEFLTRGMLPLWAPYQTLGFPIHADPQSGAWYPIAWILGLFQNYSINTSNFEYIFHLFVAGAGMYFLSKTFSFARKVSLLIAIGYMFSGFFVGNAQHLTWVISGAWIPWVLYSLLKLYHNKNLFHSLLLSFFAFLLLSGGYPAFSMVLFYILIAICLVLIIDDIKNKKWCSILAFSKYLGISIFVVLLTSIAIMVSLYYVLPYLTRTGGVSLHDALFGPFSPQCMLSFVLPYTVVNHDMHFFVTDLSMSNAYFGIILFIFALVGIFMKKNRLLWLFTIVFITCLTASFGDYLPVREILYKYVPMMNMFRFPSMFRLFVIIAGLLLAGHALQYFFFNAKKISNILIVLSVSVIIYIIAGIILFRLGGYVGMKLFIIENVGRASEKSTIMQHFVFQGVFQIGLLILFIGIIRKVTVPTKAFFLLIILSVCDLMFAEQLNAPYTVTDLKFKNKNIDAFLDGLPKGFPIPNHSPVWDNENIAKREQPFWKNLSIYNKQISQEGFTPFRFNNNEYLADNYPDFFRTMLNNPPLFLSASIYPIDSLQKHYAHKKLDPKFSYLASGDYNTANSKKLSMSTNDSAYIRNFSPVDIDIVSKNQGYVLLNYIQNNYYGWKATVNGQKATILTVNLNTIGLLLPPGENHIRIYYNPVPIRVAYYISIGLFLALTFTLAGMYFNARYKSK